MTEKISDSKNTARGLAQALDTGRAADREGWLFLIVVSAVLVGLYAYTFYLSPDLRVPPGLIVLSGLMGLHLALYWGIIWIPQRRWPWVIYLAVQTLLATALVLYTRNQVLVIGLYAPLIGLSVGAIRDRRLAAGAVVIYLGLLAWATIQVAGAEALASSLVFIIPMVVFVVTYVVLFNRQVEARSEAQALLEELEIAHRELASYAAQVEDLTLAAERQRMARELHDTLAQGLAGLILQLEAADAHLEDGRPERAKEIVQQAMSRARAALVDARRAIGDLRESTQRQASLEEAIRVEAERFSRSTGIPCDLDISIRSQIPNSTSEHAYRIVAETLANVAQHAQAERGWITAIDQDEWLVIEVRDDGRGILQDEMEASSGHYGLIGIRERARLAGGSLVIHAKPGGGTLIRASPPLAREMAGDHAI